MLLKEDDFWKPVITTRQVIEGTDSAACVTLEPVTRCHAMGALV